MPFEPGHKKIAGRQKGTTNKVNTVVSDILQAKNMNLVDEAISLYSEGDHEFKLKVLTLLFPYAYAKKTEVQDTSVDITPENEIEIVRETLEYINHKFPNLLPPKDE